MKQYCSSRSQGTPHVLRGETTSDMPDGLSPYEHATWTLTTFTHQVTTLLEDTERVLRRFVENSDEEPLIYSVGRRRRDNRKRMSNLRSRAN